MAEGSVGKIGACVFCGDLTVLINEVRRVGERDGGGFEKEAE